MQWRKADGTTGEYVGPLVELGKGIPRNLPPHGIRRAIFDLAFGYISGFPIWDVLVFSARSLFPQRPPCRGEWVEQDQSSTVGTVWIACPECGESLPATVSAEVVDHDGDGLHSELVCTPDMTDVHAHVWAHQS